MILYDVEMKTNYEVMMEIYHELLKNEKKNEAEEFYIHSLSNINKKWEILKEAKKYIEITCKDHSPECMYCGCKKEKKGLFCDERCEELMKEENKINK